MKKRSEKMDIVTVTNTQDMVSGPETLALLSDIRSLIEAARMRVSTTANVEMVLLYWHIGNRILKDILGKERADYGKQIVQTLSGKLTLEYGRGFTRTNLFNMIRCAEVFPDREIVHALSGQLSWTHFRENNLIKSPQSTQSSAIPATAYETAPPSRRGTQMTRIGRNLHANCMQIARKNYDLPMIVKGYRETEPQINADERRFVNLDIHRKTQEALAR